jgi:hypothetical protein
MEQKLSTSQVLQMLQQVQEDEGEWSDVRSSILENEWEVCMVCILYFNLS